VEGTLKLRKQLLLPIAVFAALLTVVVALYSDAAAQEVGVSGSKICDAVTPLGGTVTCTSNFTNLTDDQSGTLGPRTDTITAPASLAGEEGTSPTQNNPVVIAPNASSPDETWSFSIPNDPELCGQFVTDTVSATLTLEDGTPLPASASGGTRISCADLTLNKVTADGVAQSGVTLEVSGPDGATDVFSCNTDAEGSCTIEDLAPGSYDVSEPTPPEGYELVDCLPDPVNVTIDGPNEVTCTNELIPVADLILNKVTADGQAQSGVTLEVSGPDGATDVFSCITDAEGTCTIEDLTPGSYDVSEPTPPEGYELVDCVPDPVNVTVDGPNEVTCTNELVGVVEWCSPGYWKNHLDEAENAAEAGGFSLDDTYSEHFGAAPPRSPLGIRRNAPTDPTLQQVLENPQWYGGGAANNVADLLSAAHPDVNFEEGDERVENCPLN